MELVVTVREASYNARAFGVRVPHTGAKKGGVSRSSTCVPKRAGGIVMLETRRVAMHGGRVTVDDSRVSVDDSRLTSDGSRLTTDGSRLTTDGSRLTIDGSRLTIDGT
jgi:hypothetical protein